MEDDFDPSSDGQDGSDATKSGFGISGTAEPEEPAELTQEELDTTVEMKLIETSTHTLLYIPGVCVQNETPEHYDVTEKNRKYEELVKARTGSDLYVERHAQTFNFAQKHKEVMAAPPTTREVGCTATDWDIYDMYENDDAALTEDDGIDSKGEGGKGGKVESELGKQVDEVVAASLASPGCLLNINGSDGGGDDDKQENGTSELFGGNESNDVMVQRQAAKILKSGNLIKSLHTVERAIQQNLFHPRHLMYRNFPSSGATTAASAPAPVEPGAEQSEEAAAATTTAAAGAAPTDGDLEEKKLEKLWSFKCPLTRGRTISCMAWNRVNKDLLAVSYGQFDFTNQKDGMVCFWSLKNPEYPERILRMACGVTALDFSLAHPNLLAVKSYEKIVWREIF